jgi:general secretion pathway protein N
MERGSRASIVVRCRHSCGGVLATAVCVAFASISTPAAVPVAADALQNAPAGEPRPTGNPLWAVPLDALSMTHERPLFSPSRRPPPIVVAVPEPAPARSPPPPAEPERPRLTLLGTIVGESGSIGVFLDPATQDVIRLRTGEAHDAWMLRSVRGREVGLEKNRLTAILSLPAPGADPKAQSVSPAPSGTQPYPPAQHRKRLMDLSTIDAGLQEKAAK